MNVVIIEDEKPAAEKLERYLLKYDPATQVLAKLTSVLDSVQWLKNHQDDADLIFMDIQLTDGMSFQIFQETEVRKPVIFITAFNEFALDAFKVNSIDYLLKPITFIDLTTSLKKLELLREQLSWSDSKTEQLKEVFAGSTTKYYKTRFMVKLGDHIRSLTIDQISFFYAEGRDVYLVTNQPRKFIVDYTLETLEGMLDPTYFFRVNRSFILKIDSIKDVIMHSNSRLKVLPTPEFDKEIIVSREKVNEFKNWFDGQ